MKRSAGAALVAFALSAPALPAQSMRSFTVARQRHGEQRLSARLDYAAGSLRVVAGIPSGDLYRMRLWYDAERFTPTTRFEAATGTVQLGLSGTGGAGLRVVSAERGEQSAVLTITPEVPVALTIRLGAVDADLDLGGLQLTGLDLGTSASRTTVRFSRRNAASCASAVFSAGAADISIVDLGNSGCRRVRVEGGVGKTLLDLTGAWPAGARIDVRMAVGALSLRLARSVGVRLTMDRFLSSFPAAGWVRRGDALLSDGYARAERRIDVSLSATIGGVSIQWVE